MGFINFMVSFAWEIILIFVAFAFFGYIMKNGFSAVKKILSTLTALLEAFGKWIREKCQDYLKGESAKQEMDRDTAVAAYAVTEEDGKNYRSPKRYSLPASRAHQSELRSAGQFR